MFQEYLKATQLIIITLSSFYLQAPLLFLIAVVQGWNLQNQYYIRTIFGIIASILILKQAISILSILLAIINIWITFQLYKADKNIITQYKKIKLGFLISFGISSINENQYINNILLLLFLCILIAQIYQKDEIILLFSKITRIVYSIYSIAIVIGKYLNQISISSYQSKFWWYQLSLVFVIFTSSWLIFIRNSYEQSEKQINNQQNSNDIELKQIQIQKQGQQISSQKIQNNKNKESEVIIQKKSYNYIDIQTLKQIQIQNSQSQNLNLILITPFCLLGQNILQIFIYIYILRLQWGHSIKHDKLIVMIAIILIILQNNDKGTYGAILRIMSVFIISKSIQGSAQFGSILRSIWLRTSFVLVLTLLFWFSLLTVNIFHLFFIAVVLLFVTKDQIVDGISYRHRNWKYLQILFNVFIILRFFYQIYLQYTSSQQISNFTNILQLIGISYEYNNNINYFNLIPLLINAAIGLQYLTYKSKIYAYAPKKILIPKLQTYILQFIKILTIVYYKLLPWVSYALILIVLLSLQFSITSFIILFWVLLTFSVHILSNHDLRGYKRLHFMWIWFTKLTSLQIILRFTFEFAKFQSLSFLRQLPFFDILIKYEKILGLAIRDPDITYFKAVTKFQIMVSLDLASIFIAFLVTQYYLLLIQFKQLPVEELRTQKDKSIAELFKQYVDFKITDWLKQYSVYKLLRIVSKIVVDSFYPLVGLYACFNYTIILAIYLLIALRHTLTINQVACKTHIQQSLLHNILCLLVDWRKKGFLQEPNRFKVMIQKIKSYCAKQKINSYNRLRLLTVITTMSSILLTYFAGSLFTSQIRQIMNQQTILKTRWWLYVGGCSKQIGISAHFSKLVLILLILQKKCCWFMQKFTIAQHAQPLEQQDELTKNILKNIEQQNNKQFQNNELQLQVSQQIQPNQIIQIQQEYDSSRQVIQMKISLVLGTVKLLERCFVMILVFGSIVQVSHPFGIIYLVCAFLLNYLGSVSIKTLSRMLFFLIIFQYFLLISNYTSNQQYFFVPQEFNIFKGKSLIQSIFGLSSEWQNYLTFGKNKRELGVLFVSWLIVVMYPFYFFILRRCSIKVIQLLQRQDNLTMIGKKAIQLVRQIYQYGLVYSPIVIMLLCLWIYLLDYTTTNLLLTFLTVGFIFLSFLIRQYKDSRHFWRFYFVILQLMVVSFMLLNMLLQLPMLSQYCLQLHLFCSSSQDLYSQVLKALLLLILQLGLDLTHSHHFDRALKKQEKAKLKSQLLRIAIAQRHNDRKIQAKFKQCQKQQQLIKTVEEVQQFLSVYKQNQQVQFGKRGQNYQSKQSWLDVLMDFLPEFIDEYLMLSENQARQIVIRQNKKWMSLRQIPQQEIVSINQTYLDYFCDVQNSNICNELSTIMQNMQEQSQVNHKQIQKQPQIRQSQIIRDLRQSIINASNQEDQNKQKQQLIYIFLAQSLLSNWHYLTYFVLIFVHIRNIGLLTLPIPITIFCCGLVSGERAGKNVWRWLICFDMIPLLVKFIIRSHLLLIDKNWQFILIGNNLDSDLLQYLGIVMIIGECIILKMIGHFHETTQQIECMKMGLIRKMINNNDAKKNKILQKMLQQSKDIPFSFYQMIFSKSQLKIGYDYSTLLTSLQLSVLIWVFLFYDRMAVRQQVTFYKMIQYNQFNAGMVVLTFVQLAFLLIQRFVAIADMRQWSIKWQTALIIKYLLLIMNFIVIQFVILFYFPFSSGRYQSNMYITILLILSLLSLLVQTMQIKKGLDQASRGFMDRYTWYNGFIYMGFRAIPFLFQFKVFSDWTFTKTSIRIFDWIRLQQIFGRLYVAKCNALFLSGKLLGSKIQYWKKLLMGFPLLLSIIILLFGPLVLFSGLNPLASTNDIKSGYLQVVLKLNYTNQYPLYTNSHITNIQRVLPNQYEKELYEEYDIDPLTVQKLTIQQFSDQYWEISEGSYFKLLDEPLESIYQLSIRAKFQRYQTGSTYLFELNQINIQRQDIDNFKMALMGNSSFCVEYLLDKYYRLDNNNGIHTLQLQTDNKIGNIDKCLIATAGTRAAKQYWIVQGGIQIIIASDKYTKAIFGYSVMSFYISIILVIANYFRFLFQGSVHTIITSDIPYPDPILAICNQIYRARRIKDLEREEYLFWIIVDLLRSPDTIKALTGNYLQARLETLKQKEQQKDKIQ